LEQGGASRRESKVRKRRTTSQDFAKKGRTRLDTRRMGHRRRTEKNGMLKVRVLKKKEEGIARKHPRGK